MTWQPYEHDSDSLDCKCRECLLGVIEQLEAQLRAERQPAPEPPTVAPPAHGWNIEQILVYIWQCLLGEERNPQDYPWDRQAQAVRRLVAKWRERAEDVRKVAAGKYPTPVLDMVVAQCTQHADELEAALQVAGRK
jgi:hypothetical protein